MWVKHCRQNCSLSLPYSLFFIPLQHTQLQDSQLHLFSFTPKNSNQTWSLSLNLSLLCKKMRKPTQISPLSHTLSVAGSFLLLPPHHGTTKNSPLSIIMCLNRFYYANSSHSSNSQSGASQDEGKSISESHFLCLHILNETLPLGWLYLNAIMAPYFLCPLRSWVGNYAYVRVCVGELWELESHR